METQPNSAVESCPVTEDSVAAEAGAALRGNGVLLPAPRGDGFGVGEAFVCSLVPSGLCAGTADVSVPASAVELGAVPCPEGLSVRQPLCRSGPSRRRSGRSATVRAHLIQGGRRSRFSSLGRGLGSDPGRLLAVGGAVRDTVGHTDELSRPSRMICQARGAGRVVPLHRGDRASGVGSGAGKPRPFMQQMERRRALTTATVLVIEVDGKCPPTATRQELSQTPRQASARPQAVALRLPTASRPKSKRQAGGPKKHRKKGDKSKNGKEVVVVVMYTFASWHGRPTAGPVNKGCTAVCRAEGGGVVVRARGDTSGVLDPTPPRPCRSSWTGPRA